MANEGYFLLGLMEPINSNRNGVADRPVYTTNFIVGITYNLTA